MLAKRDLADRQHLTQISQTSIEMQLCAAKRSELKASGAEAAGMPLWWS
jgi:hypothetical protein